MKTKNRKKINNVHDDSSNQNIETVNWERCAGGDENDYHHVLPQSTDQPEEIIEMGFFDYSYFSASFTILHLATFFSYPLETK